MNELKKHWEAIYQNKSMQEVSWYQKRPNTSLEILEKCNLDKDAPIIDIGGGDSFFVDHLLALAYTDITFLDISGNALKKAQQRLGNLSSKVKWIESDILSFQPKQHYQFWHDRAVFHFLREKEDVKHYKSLVNQHIQKNGHLALATFSDKGPLKCSGLEVNRYSPEELTQNFSPEFRVQSINYIDHLTPFDTVQSFTCALLMRV